jgi:hypothetical protein
MKPSLAMNILSDGKGICRMTKVRLERQNAPDIYFHENVNLEMVFGAIQMCGTC